MSSNFTKMLILISSTQFKFEFFAILIIHYC